MLFGRNYLNLVFTDNSIRFAVVNERKFKVKKIGEMRLKSGVIINGKIVDENLLGKILGTLLRKYRLTSSFVKFMIPDQNLVIKKMQVPKYLENEDLRKYLKLELEESMQSLPYKDPIIDFVDYNYVNVDDDNKDIIIFTTSKEIVEGYLKVIQKYKKNVVNSYISPLLIRKLYLYSKKLHNNDQRFMMFTQIRENTHILTVFDNEIPILSLRDTFEIENINEEYYTEQIFDVIERICHFFQYQFSKGTERVQKIVLYSELDFNINLEKLINEKTDIEVEVIKDAKLRTSLKQDLTKYYLPISMSL